MNRELDEETADFLLLQVEKARIQVRFNTSDTEFIGDTDLEQIRLTDGQLLPRDTFIVCAEIIPNTELARETGLEVGRGVKVNDYMQTSGPFIYAVGRVHRAQ